MKADSDSVHDVVQAPLPETILVTNTMWKHKTEEKHHNFRNFALLKFLNGLN